MLQAPQLTVSGQTLSWARVAGVNTYVFVRKVPGQADQYSVITGTSITPPPVPGVTVRYSVRTVRRRQRVVERTVDRLPRGRTRPTRSRPRRSSVSGQTLTWQPINKVSTYVLASKVPGHADRYTEVSGTSVTPAAVPGATVALQRPHSGRRQRVVTESQGLLPCRRLPRRRSPPSAPVSSGPFEMGLVAGSAIAYELPYIQQLGAHTARMEFSINTPVSQMESIDGRLRAGRRRPLLLAGFDGRLPSTGEAQNLAGWAAAFGPGGTFWQGKSYPASAAVTDIEFGNETSYSYQFSDTSSASNWYALSSYVARAQTYALRFKDAETRDPGGQPERRAARAGRRRRQRHPDLGEQHVRGRARPRPAASRAGRCTRTARNGKRRSTGSCRARRPRARRRRSRSTRPSGAYPATTAAAWTTTSASTSA